jgi:Flp pilus assembly protein TadG
MLEAFRSNARETAAIEFAIGAVVLVTAVLNAIDVGYYEYQRMEVENAAQVGAETALANCNDPSYQLPATVKCTGLNTLLTTAIQSTSLGTNVSLASGSPTEGYYCVKTTTGALQSVGSLAAKPTDCSAAGSPGVLPGDYIQVGVTYPYASMFPGVTVMSVWGISSITMTAWMRLA